MNVYLENLSFQRSGEIVRVYEYGTISAFDQILHSREKIWIWNEDNGTLKNKSGEDIERVLSRGARSASSAGTKKRSRDDLDYVAMEGTEENSTEIQQQPVVPENQLRNDDSFLLEVISVESKKEKAKKRRKPGPKPRDARAALQLELPENKEYLKNFCSTAWVFFDLKDMLTSNDSKMKLRCRACSAELSYDREQKSSKDLMNHCKKKHEKLFDAAKDIDFKGLDAYYSLDNFRVMKNAVEKQCTLFDNSVKMVQESDIVVQFVCWVISANISLGKFRNKYWSAFKASCTARGVNLPGRKKMVELIGTISMLADITATQSIKSCGSIALAIDMWTSLTKDHYMGVTYHWIDENWNLNARVMELYPFFGSATGKMLAQVIEERFNDRFGDEVVLAGIVSDRGSNVKFARNELVPYDSEDCVAHLLNSCVGHVVGDSMSADSEEKNPVTSKCFSASIQSVLSQIQTSACG